MISRSAASRAGFSVVGAAVGGGERHAGAASDLADAGDGDAGDCLRDGFVGTRGEEQFVFVAAVQSELQPSVPRRHRQRLGVDHRADAALLADVRRDRWRGRR